MQKLSSFSLSGSKSCLPNHHHARRRMIRLSPDPTLDRTETPVGSCSVRFWWAFRCGRRCTGLATGKASVGADLTVPIADFRRVSLKQTYFFSYKRGFFANSFLGILGTKLSSIGDPIELPSSPLPRMILASF
jgi:hypothetical protein